MLALQVEAIPRAAEVARVRIQEEVLDPLHDWLAIYSQIQVRLLWGCSFNSAMCVCVPSALLRSG
jgi:hypothetical protein